MQYNKINNTVGWAIWLIATVVYVLTLEPSVSFWDCGEFISAAYKMQVVHPPGAPFFLLLGRMFTLFAPGPESVAYTVNLMSGLSSSFTILFLFWTVTHFTRKIAKTAREELSKGQLVAIMGSGVVGALCYTFSDSFWFSAVEGEVYALSSFFTAIVFWAILKWEDNSEKDRANKWLILIAYLMGLSIGVHLLNLLCIPAICFVYYFKKYKPSKKGIITTFLVSVLILGLIQYGIIPGIPTLATKFELLFVNGMGMPFNTGLIIFLLLGIGFIIFGIWYTQKSTEPEINLFNRVRIPRVPLNTAFLCLSFILIGYSSYTLTLVRSNANTSIDMNDPENVFSLLSYLNREQYGERPLFSGPYFTAELIDQEEGKMKYRKGEEEYVEIGRDIVPVYEKNKSTLFPRMYKAGNIGPQHTSFYKTWSDLKEGETPSFFDNLKFGLTYQMGHMWFRYFMWNFSGRQNDIQGQGIGADAYENGNWITGIKFLDEARLGSMENLATKHKSNAGTNKYFLLPFLLGIIGAVFHYKRHKKDFAVAAILFVLTGMAINIYLNMPPLQPRERDYAYVGSFYAYAIWVGIGVQGIWYLIKNKIPGIAGAAIASVLCLLAVPVLMASQNWDDHDRSNKYTARDFGSNYLESCSPNAILFSMGDNDTYPLWYGQEVERMRTDIRVINLSLLGTDWYINQMRKDLGVGPGVEFTLQPNQITPGLRDYVPFVDNPSALYTEKFEANKNVLAPVYQALLNDVSVVLDASEFPVISKGDYDRIKELGVDFLPNRLIGLLNKINEPQMLERYSLAQADLKPLLDKANEINQQVAASPAPLKAIIDFIASDEPNTKVPLQNGERIDYFPTKNFLIPVDKQKVLANGTVSPQYADRIVDNVVWTYPKGNILKNDLMILDLIATNDWNKPIYFTVSMGPDSYIGLQKFFQIEGLAYKVVPIQSNSTLMGLYGVVETDTMYNNMMNKFVYGNMQEDVYIDPETNRMTLNLRSNFIRLAEELLANGDKERAIATLDKSQEVMPTDRVLYNLINFRMVDPYYRAGAPDKANKLSEYLFERYSEEAKYYSGLKGNHLKVMEGERDNSYAIMQELYRMAYENKQESLTTKFKPTMNEFGIPTPEAAPQFGG